jgi:CHASE3 domain sensor protein
MKTTQKGSAAVIFVIVILILLIAGAVFAYKAVSNEEINTSEVTQVETTNQQASVPAAVEPEQEESVDDISADIDASLTTSDEDIKAIDKEFKN